MFSIHSVNSSRELIFSNRSQEYFFVELKGLELSCGPIKVWDDLNDPYYNQYLHIFFKELANFKTPWQDEQAWASYEGEFEISATCTILGNVIFWVKLSGPMGQTEEWKMQAKLETELGQLEKIAKDANIFFQDAQHSKK